MEVPQRTILVVENEAVIRLMLKDALERARYRVLEAGDGQVAAETYRSGRDSIDLVLLDLDLPGMHGLEVLDAMRTVDDRVKVIITSGNVPPGRSSEVSGCLTKPYRLHKLFEAIECVLR